MKSLSKKSATKWLLSSAIASTLIFTLAGCSNTEEENPKLEKTSDASVTEPTDYVPASADGPAQNVPEPRLPAVATENTEEGAQAALEYFWEAIDYLRLTGEVAPLQLVSDELCTLCDDYMNGWEARYAEDEWAVIHGDIQIEISDIQLHQNEEQGDEWVAIYFQLTEPPADLYSKGVLDLEESFNESDSADWIADLNFDSSAGRWVIEWAGLEEQIQESS